MKKLIASLFLVSLFALVGCKEESDAEKAGSAVENAVQDAEGAAADAKEKAEEATK